MSTAVANWPKFLAKLEARHEIAERTMAFRFEKPASFNFTPGQFIDITLLNPPETDPEGNARGFSIASAPYEDFIMVATRLRDTAFKRVLQKFPLDAEVRIEGPFGNLRLHNDKSRTSCGSNRRNRHHSFSQHSVERRQREVAASHISLLHKSTPGRCSISHRASRARKEKPKLQINCLHD